MKINDLAIDGFGVWRGLHLDRMSGQLNVFYGPNEAGKTTLLEFVRAILYGFSADRRRRYLPPRRGGDGGGWILLSTRHGDYRITRHDTGHGPEGQLRVVDGVGRNLATSTLDELLRQLGEPVFNHIFALGLDELQELGTLSDAEVTARLYQLSTGLRGITLAQVLHELESSRDRLLAASEDPAQITDLLAQREALRAELQDLRKLTGRYAELAQERDALDQTIGDQEARRDALSQETRIVEMAIRVRPSWRRRAQLDALLEPRTHYLGVAPEDVARYDDIRTQFRRRKRQLDEIEPELQRLKAALSAVKVNDALWKQGPRIDTLCDQQDWIGGLESQLAVAAGQVAELETEQVRLVEQLGWSDGEAPADMLPPEQILARLRPISRAQVHARKLLETAQEGMRQHSETAKQLSSQLASALPGRSEHELGNALETAGERVNQLRRRVQLDDRIRALENSQADLEEENRELYANQMLPPQTLVTLGTGFAGGAALLLGGLFLPHEWVGGHGLGMALLGIFSSSTSAIAKFVIEHRNEMMLDTCTQQLVTVKRQHEEATAERDELDQHLPRGGGPLLTRLQHAEKELARLEDLMPIESNRQSSEAEISTAADAVRRAEEEVAVSKRRWHETLVDLKLPPSIRPNQLAAWGEFAEQLVDVNRRLDARRQEVADRRKALDAFEKRLATVFEETDIRPVSPRILERLRQLRVALSEQAKLVESRNAQRQQMRKLRRRSERYARLIEEFKLRRKTVLLAAGVDNETDFRQRAEEQAETVRLEIEIAQVRADLAQMLADQFGEEALRPWLEEPRASELDEHWELITTQLQDLETSIRQKFEHRGQLNEQLKALAADRRPSEKRLEFDMLNERLAEAIQRWQVLAVTHRLLDAIRELYQRERQPGTLREASGYFSAMTSGRYRRVWTPLSDDILLVDDAQGNTLSIDVLSRGTREQLFLSLRLALAADYATRGDSFPLVLDDLLVNFDTYRARATAEVLKDFAETGGHQVLLFTCHEHIKQLFQGIGVRVRRLPDNSESPGYAEFEEEVVAPEPLIAEPLAVEPLIVEPLVAAKTLALPMARPIEEPAPIYWHAEPAAATPPPPYDVPMMVGESDAYLGWPPVGHEEQDLTPVRDNSEFWTLIGRSRPWMGQGAEEFDGEFAEKVVEEIRWDPLDDLTLINTESKTRAARRRRPPAARPASVASRPAIDKPASSATGTSTAAPVSRAPASSMPPPAPAAAPQAASRTASGRTRREPSNGKPKTGGWDDDQDTEAA